LCAAYFVFALAPREGLTDFAGWKEALVAGCFAAPTSTGILFSTLAAAGPPAHTSAPPSAGPSARKTLRETP